MFVALQGYAGSRHVTVTGHIPFDVQIAINLDVTINYRIARDVNLSIRDGDLVLAINVDRRRFHRRYVDGLVMP
jgi:hypothetical protein